MTRPTDSHRPDPTALLLASGLTTEHVAELLAPYGIEDSKRADANLQSMAGEPRSRNLLAVILGELLGAAAETADPDQALTHWERYLQMGVNRSQLFQYLASAPRMLHLLCAIFGNSPSLSQTLIRDPLLIYWLAEESVLTKGPSRRELDRSLQGMLGHVTAMELKLDILRRFKRREILRIGIRDLLRSANVQETTVALSDLAAGLIQAAYEVVREDLRRHYGTPFHRDRTGRRIETCFAVIAMGKLGGGELNFSSDVDLIYVYASDDERTSGARKRDVTIKSIPTEEYFEYLARGLTRALTEHTQEGAVFRVDLRLRAEGSVGQLARPLSGYEQYYRTRGQGWERQALLKAWPIAGDPSVGRAFLRMVKPFVFGPARSTARCPEMDVIEQIKSMKALIDDKMADRGHERRNVKLGIGGIREIEFLVQAVQMIAGRRRPRLLDRNTIGALARFRRDGLLSSRDHKALVDAYLFLRDVEHKLQMVHDLQTHALPDSSDELTRCAIRSGYPSSDRTIAMKQFVDDYRLHTGRVSKIFRSMVDAPERSLLLKTVRRLTAKTKRSVGCHPPTRHDNC